MRFAELKALGLPHVSARAESQVRVRTKDRFCVKRDRSREDNRVEVQPRAEPAGQRGTLVIRSEPGDDVVGAAPPW